MHQFQIEIFRKQLQFKRPSGTSRGILNDKESWFIVLKDPKDDENFGIGECGILRGLSSDDVPDYEKKLQSLKIMSWLEQDIYEQFEGYPSIIFGLEMAMKSYHSVDPFQIFENEFALGKSSIPINGLVWMGKSSFMQQQIQEKLEQGFSCIKLKIGAIDFEEELELLYNIRKKYSQQDVILRVDANGAFKKADVVEKLKELNQFKIHSIEQPVKANEHELLAELCDENIFPIALDESLIGISDRSKKKQLLQQIKPQYVILKPSLLGGIKHTTDWIELAKVMNIGWWFTSALESNIGLNAISQFTFDCLWKYGSEENMFQGLGTGGLYTNNIESPLQINNGAIHYSDAQHWDKNWIVKTRENDDI